MESLGFPSGYALFEGNDSTLVQIRVAQTALVSGLRYTGSRYRAWALSTENSEVVPWHTLQDSPNVEVFSNA